MPQHVASHPRPSGTRAARALTAAMVFMAAIAAAPARPAARGTPAPAVPGPAAPSRSPLVTAVGAIGLTVSDLDESVAFFTGVLDFELVGEVEVSGPEVERALGVFGVRARVATLRLGRERVELTQFIAPEGRPIPPDWRSHDRWFQHIAIVVSDMDAAYRRLREHRVRHASSGPQRLPDWNKDAGGISAFYFKDADGHVLEVIQFPPGKGDPRWQVGTGLFLGIDHTAIVVADTEVALGFYRDTLGLAVAGGAENYGVEQEHLNNVFGARLRITALKAADGPGVELLEYLAPADGRPMPADTRANDLWHWRIHMDTPDGDAAWSALRAAGADFVSPGFVTADQPALGSAASLMVRDPDGHAVRLLAPADRAAKAP